MLVFQNLPAKLNKKNMQYEIIPSVKLQDKTTTYWTNNYSTGFTLFERAPFCYIVNLQGITWDVRG